MRKPLSARREPPARSFSDAIATLAELAGAPADRQFPYLLLDGTRVHTMIEAARWCAARSGRSIGTIWAWLRKIRHRGADSVFTRGRADKGVSRFFASHPV